MNEKTADAPFYYIRSYKINELHKLNKIFKIFENENFEEIKKYINTLFEKNKITIRFEQNEDIIKMDLDVILFADKEKISFELYKEMIPNGEKDSKLIDLYSSEKEKNKVLKEILSLVYKNKGDQDGEIIEFLKKLFLSKQIPGIIDEINITSQIFLNVQKLYRLSLSKESFSCVFTLKNIFEENWKKESIKLVCNEELSTIKNFKMKELIYNLDSGQDGEVEIEFEKKDDLKVGKYKCYIQLFVNEKKITDDDLLLKIKIRE